MYRYSDALNMASKWPTVFEHFLCHRAAFNINSERLLEDRLQKQTSRKYSAAAEKRPLKSAREVGSHLRN